MDKHFEEVLNGTHQNYILPFLWLHGEDEDILRKEIAKIQQSNIHALCAESRPHPDFLGDKWWRDMDIIMDECRKRNMKVWLLDDERFPSGYAAGMIPEKYPEYGRLSLMEKHIDVLGPQKGISMLINLQRDKKLLAVAAGHRTGIGDSVKDGLIDITSKVVDDLVYWDVPEGTWRIYFIYTTRYNRNGKVDPYLNSLTEEGTQVLIDTVYESHFKRYGEEFGKTFMGFFSDEPQFGNAYGYHASIGRVPFMQLPWCNGLEKTLSDSMAEEDFSWMPGLWYDIGEKTYPVRFTYMNTITGLYEKNYAGKIGDWCRSHGVEYIGHVIEENNAHSRLGNGLGHFFRSMWGQDMAGIDVVLHEIIPGMKGSTHAWASRDFEADEEFFYYGLAKLAASLAHIDPKKKGRALCEIFGAYGWMEGLKQMKWHTDFMLVRGINYFVPHAFTPKEFPDPDCPPHFFAGGSNPQYKFFGILMDYMNRMCHLFNGGVHKATAAILYHGEAEWSGNEYMLCQKPMRVLMEDQIDADFLPVDMLTSPQAHIQDGELRCNNESYSVLIIPYTEALPVKMISFIKKAEKEGLPVIFVNSLPVRACEGESDELVKTVEKCPVVQLEKLSDFLKDKGFYDVQLNEKQPELRIYHYIRENKSCYLLFNEAVDKDINTEVTLKELHTPICYDAMTNINYSVDYKRHEGSTTVNISLKPYETCVLVFGADNTIAEGLKARPVYTEKTKKAIAGEWKVSVSKSAEYPNFKECSIKSIGNLNVPGGLPRFSGTIRYEKNFNIDEADKYSILKLGEVGEIAEVWLNGNKLDAKFYPPYQWNISDFIVEGNNEIAVEVTNTLVYEQHDRLSFYQPIPASGLIGPVELVAVK